jgi:hypothetical protein
VVLAYTYTAFCLSALSALVPPTTTCLFPLSALVPPTTTCLFPLSALVPPTTRFDLEWQEPFDIRSMLTPVRTISEAAGAHIYAPSHQRWGGFNDKLALGTPDAMSGKYCCCCFFFFLFVIVFVCLCVCVHPCQFTLNNWQGYESTAAAKRVPGSCCKLRLGCRCTCSNKASLCTQCLCLLTSSERAESTALHSTEQIQQQQ